MRKVTQKDIADALQLSRISVSKALNNETGISEATKLRIYQKAKEMGYPRLGRYAGADGSIEASRPNVYLIIHEGYNLNHFWGFFVRGIVNAVQDADRNLILCFVRESDVRHQALPMNYRPEDGMGVIVLGTYSEAYIGQIAASGLPAVFIDTLPTVRETGLLGDTIIMVNESPVYALTEGLIRAGHRQIGFIGEIQSSKSFRERYEGYRRAMADNGVAVDPGLVMTDRPAESLFYTEPELRQGVKRFGDKPTAIVCVNDHTAIWTINALQDMGRKVPEDVKVCGFDNIESAAHFELTTVHCHKEEMGRRAGEELLWRIAHPDRPFELVRVATEIICRASTGELPLR